MRRSAQKAKAEEAWDGLEPGRADVLRAYVPRPPLSQLVQIFWYYDSPIAASGRERIMPGPGMQLIVRLSDERPPMTVMTGLHSSSFIIDKVGRDRLFGVMFRPGGAHPFLGMPAGELKDQQPALEDIWGPSVDELRDLLVAAPTVEACFAVAERWLVRRARLPLSVHGAVQQALAAFGDAGSAPRVTALAEAAGMSRRRFIEVFTDQVGLPPKLCARILRFQAALKAASVAPGAVDWTDLALTLGYYDQAHFANEFKEFSGMTTSVYMARRGIHLNHIALD